MKGREALRIFIGNAQRVAKLISIALETDCVPSDMVLIVSDTLKNPFQKVWHG